MSKTLKVSLVLWAVAAGFAAAGLGVHVGLPPDETTKTVVEWCLGGAGVATVCGFLNFVV